jgi:hypothetical protein
VQNAGTQPTCGGDALWKPVYACSTQHNCGLYISNGVQYGGDPVPDPCVSGNSLRAWTLRADEDVIGIAAGDVNGDKRPDAVLGLSGSNYGFQVTSIDGNFTPTSVGPVLPHVSGGYGAVGDLDGDILPEIVGQQLGTSGLVMALGPIVDGVPYKTTTISTAWSYPSYIITGAFDAIPGADIAVDHGNGTQIAFFLAGSQTESFSIAVPSGYAYEIVKAGDLNGDGLDDIVVPASTGVYVALSPFSASTVLQAVTTGSDGYQAVGVGKLDAGTTIDLVVCGTTAKQLVILSGNGDGTFTAGTPLAVAAAPSILSIGDFDGNGVRDVAAGYGDGVIVYPGTATSALGTPQPKVGGYYFKSVTADFNGDGADDVLTFYPVSGGRSATVLMGCPGAGL